VIWVVVAIVGLACIGLGVLALAACVAAGRADELAAGHYLTPEDLAPMTEAQHKRLEEQRLIEHDGPPPAA